MDESPEDSSRGCVSVAGCCNDWGGAEQPRGDEGEESKEDPLVWACEVGRRVEPVRSQLAMPWRSCSKVRWSASEVAASRARATAESQICFSGRVLF